MEQIDFQYLQKRISTSSPAPFRSAFTPHSTRNKEDIHYKEAAVLIPLFKTKGEWHTVYIKRSTYQGHHSGEISFPGGQLHQGENTTEAALRETKEEIGVSPRAFTVLGALHPVSIQLSRFHVTPIVAYSMQDPLLFVADPQEVEEIIPMPLSALTQSSSLQRKNFTIGNNPVELHFFMAQGSMIWGATGLITSMFLNALGKSPDITKSLKK